MLNWSPRSSTSFSQNHRAYGSLYQRGRRVGVILQQLQGIDAVVSEVNSGRTTDGSSFSHESMTYFSNFSGI